MHDLRGDYGAEHARNAIEHGSDALSRADHAGAIAWLERALRLAPDDPTALYLLASAYSAVDADHALRLLSDLIGLVPAHRSAAISRVALLHRTFRAEDAAAQLDRLLSTMGVPRNDAFAGLADAVTRDSGRVGWFGTGATGHVRCHAPPLTVRLDAGPPRRYRTAHWQLPPAWRDARYVHARAHNGELLGACLDVASITAMDGVVEALPDGRLRGWACAVNDPDAEITIEVFADENSVPALTLIADDRSVVPPGGNGAQQVRGFEIPPRAAAARAALTIHANGCVLRGSPITLPEEARAAKAAARRIGDPWRPLPALLIGMSLPPARAVPCRAPIAVILPVFRGVLDFDSCLQSLPEGQGSLRIIAIDDAIPEPALRDRVERAASDGTIELLRHTRNRGFPAAVNTGFRHAAGHDLVILNTDTLLPPGAIARLADAAYEDAQTGTVTPLTNDGSITSYAGAGRAMTMPTMASLRALDDAAQAQNGGLRVLIPSCVGFCAFIRHDCLAETGLFREDAFAQGYGEENDFSLRAAHLGWRHVVACDVVVAHAGGHSFGAARSHLLARNQDILNRLHPGYDSYVARVLKDDPLRPARFGLAAGLWRSGRKPTSIVLVTHDSGGGVERHVRHRVSQIQASGSRAIVIRPRHGITMSDGCEDGHPGLVFDGTDALAEFVAADRPDRVEFHHSAGYAPDIDSLAHRLGVPYDIIVHDFAAICPRVTLCGGSGRYCGEPLDVRDCEACIADHGARIAWRGSVAGLRQAQAARFAGARRVIVPTRDAARRVRRHLPGGHVEITPWEEAPGQPPALVNGVAGPINVAVLGAIGPEKGFAVLLACARDAARRDLKLRFTVVGHTIDDARLLDTGRVFITGPFAEGQAATLLGAALPDIGFLPSVWPETWCYALSELWRYGLSVVAFDLGAQKERIAASGRGTLLPLNLPPRQINETLLDGGLTRRREESSPFLKKRTKKLLPVESATAG